MIIVVGMVMFLIVGSGETMEDQTDSGVAVEIHEGPTGHVTWDEPVDDVEGVNGMLRWLGPRRPRLAAAVLLVASAVATFLVTSGWLGRSLSTLPTGQVAMIEFAPLASGAVLTIGLAVFVLGGSLAARVLGVLAVLAGVVPLVMPFVLFGIAPEELGPSAVPWVIAVALHVATLVALLVPRHAARRSSQRAENAPA